MQHLSILACNIDSINHTCRRDQGRTGIKYVTAFIESFADNKSLKTPNPAINGLIVSILIRVCWTIAP